MALAMSSAETDVEDVQGSKRANKAEQISDSRNNIVQACCSLAEGILLNDRTHESRWDTFEPEFLGRTFPTPPRERPSSSSRTPCQSSDCNNGDGAAIRAVVDWDTVPPSLRPASGNLNSERAGNKEKQVEALLREALPLVDRLFRRNGGRRKVEVVEFGAGSGHFGLLLAYLRRDTCSVTLLERKEYACRQARQRAEEASLDNIGIANTSMHEFANYCVETKSTLHSDESKRVESNRFDLGISLHSCGVLTDAALALCLTNRAAYCLCPCCYGQTASNLPDDYLPRSKALEAMHSLSMPLPPKQHQPGDRDHRAMSSKERRRHRKLLKTKPFYTVARSADCTSAVGDRSFVTSSNFILAKRCMQIVDADRLLWAAEHGYEVRMASLTPLDVTPKNNLIVGIPAEEDDDEDAALRKPVDLIALAASAGENADAEAGEKHKTFNVVA